MYLKSLSLKNFRNFAAQDFAFDPHFNFIFGKNAQGKTNIIEAICYLATLKSFRSASRDDLITTEADAAKLEAVFEKDEFTWEISIILHADERRVLLNGKRPQSQRQYHELIPLIVFEPGHIYLFRDSPSRRRQYLNRALYLQDAGYFALINDYDKVVAQKNRILKEGRDLASLSVWDEKLADLGAHIVFLRLKWFATMAGCLEREYQALSGSRERLCLSYKPSQNMLAPFADPLKLSREDIRHALMEKILALGPVERERRESLVGPHRDDFAACLEGRRLDQLGSQGENRSAVIALKLAQLKMYAEKFGKTPLFLLDDVASELDADRCRYLFSYLRDEATQVFITTTENGIRAADFKGRSRSFLVEAGRVSVVG